MKLTNAIKKAEKMSGQTIQRAGGFYFVTYKGYDLSFFQNGRDDEATNYYTKKHGMSDDYQSDYFAGTFHENLSQGFRFVDRMEACSNA